MATVLAQPPVRPPANARKPEVRVVLEPPAPLPPPSIEMAPGLPATPPPPLPTPSPAARELALRLIERIGLIEHEARRSVERPLRWSRTGATCDSRNEECRRIAEEIVAREAPRVAGEMRDALSRVLGARFDQTMSVGQITEAARFLGGDAGQALIGSFVSLNREAFAAFEPALARPSPRNEALAAEFARRTQHLPQVQRQVAPVMTVPVPAPPPPPPPRN
jgi:hypothetical protein